jgi:hypothetical protein
MSFRPEGEIFCIDLLHVEDFFPSVKRVVLPLVEMTCRYYNEFN